MSKRASQDPPKSLGPVWHDPVSYSHFEHGPPYLPEGGQKVASLHVSKLASRVSFRFRVAGEPVLRTRMKMLLEHFQKEYGNKPYSELGATLSYLRALSVLHQSHHWMTRGTPFYSDHLMYDRIYEAVLEDIDSIAERAVGTPGASREIVHPVVQTHQLATLISAIEAGGPMDPTPDGYAIRSLQAELSFLIFVNIVVEDLKAKGQLSRGTDNLLADIQDRHEGHVYLLKQRLGHLIPNP